MPEFGPELLFRNPRIYPWEWSSTYYYKAEYICRECMNPDVPVVYPSLMGSSAGQCGEEGVLKVLTVHVRAGVEG